MFDRLKLDEKLVLLFKEGKFDKGCLQFLFEAETCMDILKTKHVLVILEKKEIVKKDTPAKIKRLATLPGGKRHFGETSFQCAFRELYEKTGLEITDNAEIDNVIQYYDSGIIYMINARYISTQKIGQLLHF